MKNTKDNVTDFTMSELKWLIMEKCPDFIDMTPKNIDRYRSLLLLPSDRNNLTFRGIKIREIK